MIKYIELKSGFNNDGPAWVANVKGSRTGSTIYFNGMALKKGHGNSGNYFDFASGDEYWISNVKKRGSNRHWAGSGKIAVERSAVTELKALLNLSELDNQLYEVIPDFPETEIQALHENENTLL